MAKIREVFESDAIAHVWIYGRYKSKNGDVTVTEGRTKSYRGYEGYVAGNQHFTGDIFYSYDTEVARRYNLGDKGILYLVSSHDYGPTTKGQVWSLLRAIPESLNGKSTHTFSFDTTGRFPNGLGKSYESEWVSISDFLIAQAGKMWEKARKARDRRGSYVEQGFELLAKAERLIELLELPYDGLITKVRRELQELPAYAPDLRPKNPNQRKYIRDWNDALEYLPNLPMIAAKTFRSNTDSLVLGDVTVEDKVITKVLDAEVGSKLTIKLKLSDCPWANIKVVGDRVLTSLGVRLGRDEATKLYEAMLDIARNQNRIIQCQNYSVRYDKWGQYPSRHRRGRNKGSIVVGCHYFDPSTLASGYKYLVDNLPESGKITS